MATPVQAVFGRDMIFNLTLLVYWRVITTENQQLVDIDNVQEDARWAMHDYAIGYQVYVEMTGIYQKLGYILKRTV